MKLSELILKRKLTRFSSVVPLLTHIYMEAHNWNADDYIGEVYKRKREYITHKLLILNIKNKKIDGHYAYKSVLDCHGNECLDESGWPEEEVDLEKSDVNLIELIRYMVNELNEISIIPDELLIAAGIEPPERKTSDLNRDGERIQEDASYEDVISDETILKLKELPPPQMKQQVVMLAAEKKKTDAAVMAAAKIGLLFYEEGLQKPVNEKLFVAEYKKHLDKFPALFDTTIKRIYKNLPDGYRASLEGGKMPTDQVDLTPIIRAAVYAGSIYDTDDVKILKKLKSELAEQEYELPSDDVLNKIIEAVNGI